MGDYLGNIKKYKTSSRSWRVTNADHALSRSGGGGGKRASQREASERDHPSSGDRQWMSRVNPLRSSFVSSRRASIARQSLRSVFVSPRFFPPRAIELIIEILIRGRHSSFFSSFRMARALKSWRNNEFKWKVLPSCARFVREKSKGNKEMCLFSWVSCVDSIEIPCVISIGRFLLLRACFFHFLGEAGRTRESSSPLPPGRFFRCFYQMVGGSFVFQARTA